MPAGTTPRYRHLALRAALALGSTVGLGPAACAERGCPLMAGPYLELTILGIDGSLVASAAFAFTYNGADSRRFACGDDKSGVPVIAQTCDRAGVPVTEDGVSGTLAIVIDSPGY
ncbi:MAG: hypothetical protein U0168_26860, partial [Nannocystaceae bacterium]